jgi:hypothetical protein
VWSYTGSTRHRARTKRTERTGECRRNANGGTRNVHGIRRRVGYRHGYTDARSIESIIGPKDENMGESKWLQKEGQSPQETNGNNIDAQEIQSRARSDAMKLQLAHEDNTSLKEELSQEGKEKTMAQKKVDEMENQIQEYFKPSQTTKEYR